MQIRDRIKELRRVSASLLRPHPRNWRRHPPQQQEALRGLLNEIGYADALLARELPDGTLELIDGHLRAETTPESHVPVLVLDLNDAEAAKLLATLDPLAAMAQRDQELLASLLRDVHTEHAALQQLLDELLNASSPSVAPDPSPAAALAPTPPSLSTWQIVVECASEPEQQALYERLTAEGYVCRVLVL
jgi:ParB-like chromosome segregation protein Spo0J